MAKLSDLKQNATKAKESGMVSNPESLRPLSKEDLRRIIPDKKEEGTPKEILENEIGDIDKLIDPKDKMFASVKALRLTEKDIEKTINDYKETIDNIHNMDWENPDANKLATSNFLCQWCDYCGSKPNRGGFMGCPASKDFMTNNAIFTLTS